MKSRDATVLIALSVILTCGGASFYAKAQSEASALSSLSALPIASVLVASAAVSSLAVLPVVLSTAGAVLVVKVVEVSARGTVYLLERASDGAQASIEIIGKSLAGASVLAGTVLTVSVVGAGVMLSAAAQAIAFIPSELGRALLHNE